MWERWGLRRKEGEEGHEEEKNETEGEMGEPGADRDRELPTVEAMR